MPLKIIHPNHTEVFGRGLVLLSSYPLEGPRRDLYTGKVVEEAALLSKSWAIVAKESKPVRDEDRARLDRLDFDKSAQILVEDHGIKCIIEISGSDAVGITIRSKQPDPESKEIFEIIKSGFEPHFSINAGTEPARNGLASSPINNQGTDNTSTQSVRTIRLEVGPDERGFLKDQIVNSIADIVGLINAKLGFSESSSGALD